MLLDAAEEDRCQPSRMAHDALKLDVATRPTSTPLEHSLMPHLSTHTHRPPRQRHVASIAMLVLALAACQSEEPPETVARRHVEKGDDATALVHLKSALQVKPRSVELRLLMAGVLERRHDLAGAEQQLKQAIDAGGDENQLVPRIAMMMLDRNAPEELARLYRDKGLSDRVADSNLRGAVALALLANKQTTQAQHQLLDTVKTPATQLARAQLLVAEGKAPEALAALRDELAGGQAPWWLLRAAKRIAVASGDAAGGLDLMRRAHQAAPWHLGVMGEYGEALIAVGQFDQAAAMQDRLRKQAPGFFWTHYLNALLHNRAGRDEEAHAAALYALRVTPDHVPAGLLAASAELRKGEWLVANQRLLALDARQPESVPILRLLAQSQARLGQHQAAADTVKRGLVKAPGDAQLLSMKADIDLAAGRVRDAVPILLALVAARPEDADFRLRLAQAQFRLGDRVAAAKSLDQAAQQSLPDPTMLGRVVAAAMRMNNLALARRAAEQGLAKHPDAPQSLLTLAAVQSASKDQAAAWSTTLAVLDKHPSHAPALTALGAMVRSEEQRRELMTRQAKAIGTKPKTPEIYLEHASMLALEPGDGRPLVAVLETGVQVLPTHVPLREALVNALLRAGETEKALAVAQSGANMSNAPPPARALLAITYERLDKPAQGAEILRQLVVQYPQRADWRLMLARMEASAERPKDAAVVLRKLIEERPFEIDAYLALARLLAKDQTPEALAVAQSLRQRPEFKGAGELLAGDVLRIAGRNGDALEHYRKAARDGSAPMAQLRLVDLLDKTGQAEAADHEMAAVMQSFPADTRVLRLAAQRLLSNGKAAQAADLLQPVATRALGDPYLANDLAWAQLAAGRPQALLHARRAAASLPNNPNVLHTLGLCLAKAGRRDAAIAALQASSNLAPKAGLPRLHLAQQLLEAGDRIGAANAARAIDAGTLTTADQASLGKLKEQLRIS